MSMSMGWNKKFKMVTTIVFLNPHSVFVCVMTHVKDHANCGCRFNFFTSLQILLARHMNEYLMSDV